MTLNGRGFLFVLVGCGLAFTPAAGIKSLKAATPPAQPQGQQQSGAAAGQDQEVDPLKRQRSDKERYNSQKALRQELKGTYKTWLNQEVPYIITDEERKAFMSLEQR